MCRARAIAAGAALLQLLAAAGALLPAARAEDGPPLPAAATATAAPVTFPGLRIYPGERRIEVDAAFAIVDDSSFLEYAAVSSSGKLHESLLELRCPLEKLQFGLILIGLEPKAEVEHQGDPRDLTGPRVAIEAEWAEGAARKRARLEELLVDARLGREMEPVGFAFTGSRFLRAYGRDAPAQPGAEPKGGRPKEVFAASSSGSGIALYHDPDAVLDNPLRAGGDVPLLCPTLKLIEIVAWISGDERYKPNTAKLPARGTKCVLHVRPLK